VVHKIPKSQAEKTGGLGSPKRPRGGPYVRLRSKIKNELYPLIRFIIFGLVAVVIDLVTLNVSVGLGMHPSWAKITGYVLALSFTLKFVSPIVFRSVNTPFQVFVTTLVYLSTGVVNVVIFSIVFGLSSNLNIAFFAGTVSSASLNYVALRLLTKKHVSLDKQ
jgi:putative flippase GtrA